MKEANDLLASDLGKGFVKDSNSDKIEPKQTISLNNIKQYFQYISISIIN